MRNAVNSLHSVGKVSLLVTMASKGGIALLGAISAALVASVGGPTALGYFAMMRVVPSIFVLLTEFGVSNAYPYLVRRAGNDPLHVYQSGVLCILVVTIFQIVIWISVAPILNDLFFKEFSSNMVLAVGLIAPLQVIHLHVTNLLRSIDRVREANSIFISIELVLAVLVSLLAFGGKIDHAALLDAVVFSSALIAFLAVIWLWRAGYPFKPLVDYQILKSSVRYGVRSQVGNAFQVLNYRLDQLIIGGFLGAGELGVYVVAAKSAELFRVFSKSIVFVLEPLLAGKQIQEAVHIVKSNYVKVFSINFMFMLIGVMVVPYAMPIVFGGWSESSVVPFFVLAIGMVVGGGNGLINAYNFSIGAPELNTRAIGAGLISAIVANFLLVPIFGVIGAAWASVITQCVVTVSYGALFYRLTRTS